MSAIAATIARDAAGAAAAPWTRIGARGRCDPAAALLPFLIARGGGFIDDCDASRSPTSSWRSA